MTGVHETMMVAMRIGMRSKRRRRLIRCLKWPFEVRKKWMGWGRDVNGRSWAI